MANPGDRRVHVQEAGLGVTLRTDRRNTVTVIGYRPAVAGAGHNRSTRGTHFEAAELKICAKASVGVVGPSMVTLRTIDNNHVLASATASIGPPVKSQQLGRGACAHGWVTFKVPNSTAGALVVVSDDNDDSMRWVVH